MRCKKEEMKGLSGSYSGTGKAMSQCEYGPRESRSSRHAASCSSMGVQRLGSRVRSEAG